MAGGAKAPAVRRQQTTKNEEGQCGEGNKSAHFVGVGGHREGSLQQVQQPPLVG